MVVVGFAKLGGVLRLLEHQMINQANLMSHAAFAPIHPIRDVSLYPKVLRYSLTCTWAAPKVYDD